MKAHADKFDISQTLNYWFSHLPLRYDKQEAILQHEFLVDVMLHKPEYILGPNEQTQLAGIIKVLKVYGAILGNHKIHNDTIKNKMKEHVMSLPTVPLFAQKEQ